jgi:hypothetical protein
MNLTVWTGIREYIDAEIKLAFAVQSLANKIALGASPPEVHKAEKKVEELRLQSSRMETSIREAL